MGRQPEVAAAVRYVGGTVRLLRNNLNHPRPLEEWSDLGRGVEAPGQALRVLEAVAGTDLEARRTMQEYRRCEERVARHRWFRYDLEMKRRTGHDRDVFIAVMGQRIAGHAGTDKNDPSTASSYHGLIEPPRLAHYALYLFAPSKTRDNIIGDLVETYQEVMLPKFGRRRADLWFRVQVLRSVFAMLPSRVVTFFTLRWLYEWVRHVLIGT